MDPGGRAAERGAPDSHASAEPSPPVSAAAKWSGRVGSTLVVLLLLMSSAMKLANAPQVTEGLAKFGFDPKLVFGIGIVELICTALYVVPRTAAIGAILLTGYLGGAVVTHLRVGDPWITPIIVGVVLWTALVLRQPRLRAVLPW